MLYVALRCVDSLKTLLAPFLPFTSQAVHELLGYDGFLAGPLEFRTRDRGGRLDARGADRRLRELGRLVGAERAARRASSCASRAPLFRKLPPETAAEELARLGL